MTYALSSNIPNGSITVFNTLVYKGFGFSDLEAILFQLPTYGVTFTIIVSTAIAVRYYPRLCWPLAIFYQAFCAFVLLFVGLAEVGRWTRWGVWLFSLTYSIATFITAWPMISINVAGRTKKSFFGASSLFVYCIGNIIGSQIFLPSDAPKYHKGLIACAICMLVSTVLTGVWWLHYKRENRRRAEYFAAEGISDEERRHRAQVNGELDMTDRENLEFVYAT